MDQRRFWYVNFSDLASNTGVLVAWVCLLLSLATGPVNAQVPLFRLDTETPGSETPSDETNSKSGPKGTADTTTTRIQARLSKPETTVGEPVLLEIRLENAEDVELPELPSVDGLEFRMAGAPSQSVQTQILNINGRLEKSTIRSTVFRYRIDPIKEGVFEIPSIRLKNGAQRLETEKLRLAVGKAHSNGIKGDRLFVEIEGQADEVYVGQPLTLTLRIWIRSYQDDTQRIRLSENSLWGLISDESQWGPFEKRMRDLDDQRRAPVGRELLRDDGSGQQRSYVQFEIETTVFPKRPGKIDGDDVQIVVNYPTKLGRARDPMRDMFDNDLFGGSALSRMLDDDFFGSPFRNRISILASKRLKVTATVDQTRVLPLPVDGQPDNFQGAVGSYQIKTQANLKRVKAGDPIRLQISVTGDGPLDLLQAPALQPLREGFLVDDQHLAGIVQRGTKYFETTIRPKSEEVSVIPPLELPYFDPEIKEYRVAKSAKIPITVDTAETLALDQLFRHSEDIDEESKPGPDANSPGRQAHSSFEWGVPTKLSSPEVMLASIDHQRQTSSDVWLRWWFGGGTPLMGCLIAIAVLRRDELARSLGRIRSSRSRALRQLTHANRSEDIETAFALAVGTDNFTNAMGSLRRNGRYQLASECESLCHQMSGLQKDSEGWQEFISKCQSKLIEITDTARRRKRNLARGTAAMIMVLLNMGLADVTIADDGSTDLDAVRATADDGNEVSVLLGRASRSFQNGDYQVAADSFDALFKTDSIRGSLHHDAGVAYYHNGEMPKAIAHFRAAQSVEPYRISTWLALNRAYADLGLAPLSPIAPTVLLAGFTASFCVISILLLLRYGFQRSLSSGWIGPPAALATICVVTFHANFERYIPKNEVFSLKDRLELRDGDGTDFEVTTTIEQAAGRRFERLHQRGDWVRIRDADGHAGWGWVGDLMVISSVSD